MMLCLLLILVTTAGMICVPSADETAAPAAATDETTATAVTEPASQELTGKSSDDIVKMMGLGWDLGNQFDAAGGTKDDVLKHETSWGNPIVTKELIHAIAEAGFRTIRIPITWDREINNFDNYRINEAFLARVKQVVDYCYDENLIIIINMHHEPWLNVKNLDKGYYTVGIKLKAVWEQVAEYFAEYDQHLIFEGMNEPRMQGSTIEWSGNREAYGAINYLNQIFAETVRGNGKGHNSERCLMIPAYAASCSPTVMGAVQLPTYQGEVVSNLIASVHTYTPYDFCLQDTQTTFTPATDGQQIDSVFRGIRSVFLDEGIPVVIGETGATEKGNSEERVKWAEFMGRESKAYGVPIVLWDNGSNTHKGGESHAYINRSTCEWLYPEVIQSLFAGYESEQYGSALETKEDGNSYLGGSQIFYDSDGLTDVEQWNAAYITIAAKSTWFAEERKIGIVYTGSGEPKIILDSEAKKLWWMPVDISYRETIGDKKVAWFEYEDIKKVLDGYGLTDPADLRNLCVVATEGDITTYEIDVVGQPRISYMVCGENYFTGYSKEKVDNPDPAEWVFEGWYVDKKYTVPYTSETVINGDTTIYAKLRLKTEEERPAVTPEPEPTPTPEPTIAPTATPETIPENHEISPTPFSDDGDLTGTGNSKWMIVVAIALMMSILLIICIMVISKDRKN